MPKYYRFRATTPTRKPRRIREKEKYKEQEKQVTRPKLEPEQNCLDLTLACPVGPSWYLRRIAWRETPPLTGLARQLAAELRSSLQFDNRFLNYPLVMKLN